MKKLFLIGAFIYLAVSLCNQAYCISLVINYKGLDKVHVDYSYDWQGYATNVELVVENNGKLTILKSAPYGNVFRGQIIAPCTPYSRSNIRIIHTIDNHDDPPYKETAAEKTVDLANDIWGTLLFSETIDGAILKPKDAVGVTWGGLTIPAGLTLSFNKARVILSGISANSNSSSNVLAQGSNVTFNKCIFPSDFWIAEVSSSFKDCFFQRGLDIVGGAPTFEGCEFYSTVNLQGRTSARFSQNVFGTGIVFSAKDATVSGVDSWFDNGPNPSITGNAFIGSSALNYEQDSLTPMAPPPSPIPIAADNYYGDPDPILSISDSRGGMFANRGAAISINRKVESPNEPPKPFFEISGAKKTWSGAFRTDKDMPPRFWQEGYIIGQNSISHSAQAQGFLLAERQTLISVDVGVSEDKLEGVKFYALFDGEELPPTDPQITLYRDISHHGKSNIQNGKSTVNFILQKDKTTQGEHTLEVWLDPSGIAGFDKVPEKQRLLSTKLVFGGKFKRTLNINILPIQMWLPFLNGWTGAYPVHVAQEIKDNMPPMMPIRNTDINTVIHRSPYVFPSLGLLTPHTAIANGICSLDGSLTLVNLALELYAWRVARRVFNPFTPLDVVVAVLPQGAISGILTGDPKDGANTRLHRAVAFVDEAHPGAIHHEICHAFGIWSGVEQYDAHPPLGLPLQGMTAFSTDSYGRFAGGKIRHFGAKGLFWSDESYYDIMGTGVTNEWTLHQTARDFYYGLLQQVGTKALRENIRQESVSEGTKRIYIHGLTEKFLYTDPFLGSSFYQYRMVPGSMRAFVLDGVSDVSAPPPPVDNLLDECELAAIDSDFNLTQIRFSVNNDFQGLPVDVWSQNSYFSATFDVPENTRFIRIRRMAGGEFPIRAQSDSLTLEILKPYPNQTLDSDTTIEWVDTQTGGLGEAGTDNIAPILHNILISRDSGTTWEPIMESIQGSSYLLNTDLIPSGDNISLRIVSSDGIRNAFAQVDGLRIPNHAPRAWINSPLDGDMGHAATEWRLSAGAYDVEDEWLQNGTWTSSLDGVLGQGESLEEIHLSVGNHVLKYEVADSEGLKGSASVNVTVSENQNMDLALNEQSLQLKSWKFSEQFGNLPPFLTRETTYTLGLNLRSMGVETTHTLKLFLKKQGEAEKLVASQKFFQPPFGVSTVSIKLIPDTKGDYRFRGVVEDILPTDSNPANNQYIWTLKSLSGPDLALTEYFVDFGLTTKAGTAVRRDYKIGNRGDENLILKKFSIADNASGNFAIASAPAPGSAVKPGEEATFSFDYLSKTGGSQSAKFILESNDPFKPVITVDLSGACNEPRLIEIRRISDYLLGRISRSDAFDANADGIVNIADIVSLVSKE